MSYDAFRQLAPNPLARSLSVLPRNGFVVGTRALPPGPFRLGTESTGRRLTDDALLELFFAAAARDPSRANRLVGPEAAEHGGHTAPRVDIEFDLPDFQLVAYVLQRTIEIHLDPTNHDASVDLFGDIPEQSSEAFVLRLLQAIRYACSKDATLNDMVVPEGPAPPRRLAPEALHEILPTLRYLIDLVPMTNPPTLIGDAKLPKPPEEL